MRDEIWIMMNAFQGETMKKETNMAEILRDKSHKILNLNTQVSQ